VILELAAILFAALSDDSDAPGCGPNTPNVPIGWGIPIAVWADGLRLERLVTPQLMRPALRAVSQSDIEEHKHWKGVEPRLEDLWTGVLDQIDLSEPDDPEGPVLALRRADGKVLAVINMAGIENDRITMRSNGDDVLHDPEVTSRDYGYLASTHVRAAIGGVTPGDFMGLDDDEWLASQGFIDHDFLVMLELVNKMIEAPVKGSPDWDTHELLRKNLDKNQDKYIDLIWEINSNKHSIEEYLHWAYELESIHEASDDDPESQAEARADEIFIKYQDALGDEDCDEDLTVDEIGKRLRTMAYDFLGPELSAGLDRDIELARGEIYIQSQSSPHGRGSERREFGDNECTIRYSQTDWGPQDFSWDVYDKDNDTIGSSDYATMLAMLDAGVLSSWERFAQQGTAPVWIIEPPIPSFMAMIDEEAPEHPMLMDKMELTELALKQGLVSPEWAAARAEERRELRQVQMELPLGGRK